MGSGCGDSIVDKILRPPGKLPVPVALNALSPTLFRVTIHDLTENVNSFWKKEFFPVSLAHVLPQRDVTL